MAPTAAREWQEFIREERAAIQKLDEEKDRAWEAQQRAEEEDEDHWYIDRLGRQ